METPAPDKASPAPTPPATDAPPPKPAVTAVPPKPRRTGRIIGAVVLLIVIVAATHWYVKSLGTVSTDDAYVDGHFTFVAARVPGQVARVFVEDNNRVRKGDLLLQLDSEPYAAQVNIAKASLEAAQADRVIADAQARATTGQMRSLRFNLERAIEDVDNQVALLRSKVASLQSQRASLTKAQADYDRIAPLLAPGTVTREEFDLRKEALEVAQARVEEALQGVYQVRVALGLPTKPESGEDLASVPADLDQTFSSVRQAQASLMQVAAGVGVTDSFNKQPKQLVTDFFKRDPSGDIDKIYEQIIKDSPGLKQSEAKIIVAQRNLDQALLNLRFCDVRAEIDGVVTRREVNPGNNITAGQEVMAIRSLTEIWINANFKETQLASLKIGQAVDIDVDMYGRKQQFKGRISGFTMGTGSTLALLPAENATGNFVKVVQRLPVRIELLDYDPDKLPLFIGLSVTPHVLLDEKPSGPHAGAVLQPYMPTTTTATAPETRP